MLYRTILFDFDDTLVRTRETRFRGLRLILERECDIEADDEYLEKAWGLPYDEFLTTLVKGNLPKKNTLKSSYEDLGDEYSPPPYPDALTLLASLREEKIQLGIVTASSRTLVQRQLKFFGDLASSFDLILAAEDTPFHKPDPRVFFTAFERLGIHPSQAKEVLYIGDSLNDLFASQGFGLAFLGIARSEREVKAFEEFKAPYVRTLSELKLTS